MSEPQDDSLIPVPPRKQDWERTTLEKIAMASIREQQAARRWRTIVRMAWLAFFVLLAWMLFQRTPSGMGKVTEPHTAMVDIRGEIADGADASASNILPAVEAAFADQGSRAVMLAINSGGGSPVQAGILNEELIRLKKQYNKPLYAVVSDTCASGAYYIAVAADEIYVDKASMIGSVGVLMDGFGFTGTMEKLGVERRLITAGTNKGLMDPFSPLDEGQKAHMQTMLDQIHQQFIQVVREGRGSRLKETPELFSGLVWTGEQAVRMGLADKLGNTSFVAREVAKFERVVDYTQRQNVAERLARRFGSAVGEGAVKALGSMGSWR